jgi:hypothetical protein
MKFSGAWAHSGLGYHGTSIRIQMLHKRKGGRIGGHLLGLTLSTKEIMRALASLETQIQADLSVLIRCNRAHCSVIQIGF